MPERRVNVFSRYLVSWMSPILKVGYKRALEFEDIWALDYPDRSQTLSARFHKHWRFERQLGEGRDPRKWQKPSLFRALRRTVGVHFLRVRFNCSM